MADFRLERYDASMAAEWDAFVAESRNATFLFNRGYMDYHSDRFEDCSWMVRKGNRLAALLPANITPEGVLQSHGGLTYGGWILPKAHIDGNDVLEFFTQACDVWRGSGIKALDYKPLPWFYASAPSQEDEYALFRLGATLTECSLSATIDLRNKVEFNKLQRRHLAKASHSGIEITETDDIGAFSDMLVECLRERHNVSPVHSADELRKLASRFPQNIRFHAVILDGEMLAGVCVYDTGKVAHAQYIATREKGRRLNLLAPLFYRLVTDTYRHCRYFDFGISTEEHGQILNEGLLRQKYSYGASGSVYKRFLLTLD